MDLTFLTDFQCRRYNELVGRSAFTVFNYYLQLFIIICRLVGFTHDYSRRLVQKNIIRGPIPRNLAMTENTDDM